MMIDSEPHRQEELISGDFARISMHTTIVQFSMTITTKLCNNENNNNNNKRNAKTSIVLPPEK